MNGVFTMMTETIDHTISNFDPVDYEVIDWFDNRPPMLNEYNTAENYRSELDLRLEEIQQLFPEGQERTRCQHCGHAIRYVAVTLHIPSGKNVAFGQICAERCDLPDRAEHRLCYIKDEAGRRAAYAKAEVLRNEFAMVNPEFMTAYERFQQSGLSSGFLDSVVEQFKKQGFVSERHA